LQVRSAIYGQHDQLTPADMDIVFAVAEKAGPQPCPEWTALFCEALTDYVVHQNEPPDYIPPDKADWLIDKLQKSGGISSAIEFKMFIDVMTHALGLPETLSTFALREIETSIVEGRRHAFTSEDHPAGVVTAADVSALRAVLYAATTGTEGHVTQAEAEVLFDIAHATAHAQNDPSFNDLFARAIGNYLMAITLHAPDAAEALHLEKWLDQKDTLEGFLSRMMPRDKSALPSRDDFKPLWKVCEDDVGRQDMADANSRRDSEEITDSEAAWVLAHLTRGELTPAEKRLLQFLRTEAPSIAPSLRELIDKADAAVAT
jgi:hypothetical protein